MNHKTSLGLGLMLAIGSSLYGDFAHGFSLTPMSTSLDPTGKGATQAFVLDNDSTDKIPLQISMATREPGLDGNEKNTEVEDDFIIYPPQLFLGPREKRTVRVTWAGDPKPTRELAYRIIAEQLPVETERKENIKGGMIRMLLRYMGAVYVTPKGAQPNVVIASSQVARKGQLEIILENKGTAHQLLQGVRLKIKASGASPVSFTREELKNIEGQNILAGQKRRFFLPWPKNLPVGRVEAELALGQ